MGFNHDWGGNSGAAGGPPLRKAHLTNETLWSLTSHTDHSGLLHNTCGVGGLFSFQTLTFVDQIFFYKSNG